MSSFTGSGRGPISVFRAFAYLTGSRCNGNPHPFRPAQLAPLAAAAIRQTSWSRAARRFWRTSPAMALNRSGIAFISMVRLPAGPNFASVAPALMNSASDSWNSAITRAPRRSLPMSSSGSAVKISASGYGRQNAPPEQATASELSRIGNEGDESLDELASSDPHALRELAGLPAIGLYGLLVIFRYRRPIRRWRKWAVRSGLRPLGLPTVWPCSRSAFLVGHRGSIIRAVRAE